jgi:selenophosphate synthase
MERVEDAGVYMITNELAIIQTIDFFTPIVDDPITFGQIAVANSLSDVDVVNPTINEAFLARSENSLNR